MWKNTVGSYLSSIDSITDKLKTSTSLNQLNIYTITTNITFNHSQLLKQRQLSDRTCLNLDNNNNGRPFLPTNSWRALKQWLLRTPELSLVSLAGTRCSNSQIPVFKLSIKSELISKFSQLTSCNKPSYCSIPLRTTSLLFFPFSPMNFLNIIHLNDSSLENIWATSALFIGYF